MLGKLNQLSYIPSLDSPPGLSKSRKPVFSISQEDLTAKKGDDMRGSTHTEHL